MPNLSQRGAIHYLIPILLILGIIGGVYLITAGPLKLKPKASVSGPVGPVTSFTLASDKSSYKVGDLVEVKVLVRSDVAATNLFAAKINYDQSVLQLGRVDTTSFVTNWVEQYWGDAGKVSLTGGMPAPGLQTQVNSAPSKMATLYFTTLKAGTTNITFADDSAIYDNANNLNILGQKGSSAITIGTGSTPNPSVAPKVSTCEVYGDLNLDGKITQEDAQIVSDIYLGKIKIQNSTTAGDNQYMSSVGDVNGDTKIDTADAQIIQQHIDGKISTYPVCEKAKVSPCNKIGDVTGNGKITPMDTYEVLRIVLEYPNSLYTNKPYTAEQKKSADADGDGKISSVDGLHISRFIGGEINTFKACTAPVSKPIACEIYGDMNRDGKITSEDKQSILQSVADNTSDPVVKAIGDVNGDQSLTSLDALLLDRYIQGIDATVPVCKDAKASPCNGLGDITGDGKITLMDVVDALRLDARLNSVYTNKPFTDEQKRRANVDGDNSISTLTLFVKGTISTFPKCTTSSGTGDGNNNGKSDLGDMSVLLTDFNKVTGFRKPIDMNGDGKINTFDFSLMRNLLIQNKVIKG